LTASLAENCTISLFLGFKDVTVDTTDLRSHFVNCVERPVKLSCFYVHQRIFTCPFIIRVAVCL
jgi:hypothetical protein